MKERVAAMRKLHASLTSRASVFFARERAHFTPFVSPPHLRSLVSGAAEAEQAVSAASLTIDASAPHIAGERPPALLSLRWLCPFPLPCFRHTQLGSLRSYQLEGVNWLLQQCAPHFTLPAIHLHLILEQIC